MAKNYQQLAEQILPLVGGKENIRGVRHCQTRLRFTLADESKADDKALEALDGVRKVIRNAGVYQVVIGTDVSDLFAVLEPMCGVPASAGAAEDVPAEKKNFVSTVIDFVAATFQPIIPALSGSVIPIILVILVQAQVEKLLNRIIPKSVNLVFVPMLTFLIMGTLAMAVLGPIGNFLGSYLAIFFTFLSENASWAPAVLIGAFLPPMVMFGLHNGVAPLGVMQMSQLGYDSIFGPGCVCSNIAQGTAALVVALRTHDPKVKQLATSGGITALMGITEPVLYGVNLPKKYPLIAAMIGGGFGGLYAGLTHTHRYATGSSGLPAVLLYIGENSMTCFINIIIALCITVVVTAVVTWALSLKFEKKENA